MQITQPSTPITNDLPFGTGIPVARAVGTAGEAARADHVHGPGHAAIAFLVRAADRAAINNSAALVDEGILEFEAEANKSYWFDSFLYVDGFSTSDFTTRLSLPVGAEARGMIVYSPNTDTEWIDNGATTVPIFGSPDECVVRKWGVIRNGANAGTVAIQVAQGTAQVEDTVVRAGSYLAVYEGISA